jgi:hypothetical protein
MFQKKEKLYIKDLVNSPTLTYPYYYTLSHQLKESELLQDAIISLHSHNFNYYKHPTDHEEIFYKLASGSFAIYKEHYIVGHFGGKLMYLESNGWRAMPLTKEVFVLSYWLLG